VTVHDERLHDRSTPLDLTPSEAIVLARDGRHSLRRHVPQVEPSPEPPSS
jgi:hypothetical protein